MDCPRARIRQPKIPRLGDGVNGGIRSECPYHIGYCGQTEHPKGILGAIPMCPLSFVFGSGL